MTVELKARFYGRVQGVGFRYTVKQLADQLSLSGTVANMQDGSVELIAQGEKNSLMRLLFLIEDSFKGHIEKCDLEYTSILHPLQAFVIKKS